MNAVQGHDCQDAYVDQDGKPEDSYIDPAKFDACLGAWSQTAPQYGSALARKDGERDGKIIGFRETFTVI